MSAYRQKKIAMVNDLSGYGRCSLTVAIPILSAMKVQCCPIPTSILSNHTGFPVYFFDDYTEKMGEFIHKWKELGLTFDGIVSGFLGSEAQIEIVMDVIRQFGQEDIEEGGLQFVEPGIDAGLAAQVMRPPAVLAHAADTFGKGVVGGDDATAVRPPRRDSWSDKS